MLELQTGIPPFNGIGITSTVPVEVIFASGAVPVDLNNLFIASGRSLELVRKAEEAGFPRTVCSWIKGIYQAWAERTELRKVIGVTQGDCSNTHALMELIESRGGLVIPFEFPRNRDRTSLLREIGRLAAALGTDVEAAEHFRELLGPIRSKLAILDELTWKGDGISGWENFSFLVSSSDFGSDPQRFENTLDSFLLEAERRLPRPPKVRLGLLGVPTILDGLHDFIETLEGRIVFNEVPRQFSMPPRGGDLADQYLSYTYPYDIHGRIEDIRTAVRDRKLDGLIHYTQSFCFRQIQDILLRESLPVPILTIEGDQPLPLDAQLRNRIQAFMELLG